jgi:2-dehydro-3-deoxygluconokinase
VSKEELSKALDGQDAVFISGITPALSDNLYQTTILLVQLAKKQESQIYDNNYREKLWSNKQIAFDKLKNYYQ